jgi:hypothetical protein
MDKTQIWVECQITIPPVEAELLQRRLTLSLLTSYIYIYIYIYGPRFGNAESRLFLFAAQCFSTESMQEVILWRSYV